MYMLGANYKLNHVRSSCDSVSANPECQCAIRKQCECAPRSQGGCEPKGQGGCEPKGQGGCEPKGQGECETLTHLNLKVDVGANLWEGWFELLGAKLSVATLKGVQLTS